VARLAVGERLAVNLLRGCNRRAEAAPLERAFHDVADAARSSGLLVKDCAAPFLTSDEGWLLARLTLHQRLQPGLHFELSPFCDDLFARCAGLLDAAGYCLDYRNVVRLSPKKPGADTDAFRALAGEVEGAAPQTPSRQEQLVRYVNEHGRVWIKELHRIGGTRKLVANMCKRGLLRKVGNDVYAVGRLDETPVGIGR